MTPGYKFYFVDFADEEVGGKKGMAAFVKSPEFANLNVGFALDEGVASPDHSFHLYYGERNIWRKFVDVTFDFS